VTDERLIAPVRADPARTAILVDFDGTLAPIVARPEQARAVPAARGVLEEVARRFALVAVVTGRPPEDIARRFPAAGVRQVGLYGIDPTAGAGILELVPALEAAAREVPGAWVERKGISLAVHYRQAADQDAAAAALRAGLEEAVAGSGFEVIEGKMVLEVVPAGESRKGGAVRRLAGEAGIRRALYAGDDVADLEAFAALDDLRAAGRLDAALKVAVAGVEAPRDLVGAADLVVEGPEGLLELLRLLLIDEPAPPPSRP
jgi:trehalose 6-phosphate phosphatase